MITAPEFYDLLSDETRLRCLMLLYKKGELCVCEFSQTLESSQPKISRHLALLRKSGMICDERRGQWIYYRLNSSLPAWVKNVLSTSFESLQKIDPYRKDIKRVSSSCKDGFCS